MIFNQTNGGGGGGGSERFTLFATTTFSKTYTSTSAANEDYNFDASALGGKVPPMYIRIYDTAGLRNGHFYGTESFTLPRSTSGSQGVTAQNYMYVKDDGSVAVSFITSANSPTSGYGIWQYNCPLINGDDLRIRLGFRYNATNSYAIDGTFKMDIYVIDLDNL